MGGPGPASEVAAPIIAERARRPDDRAREARSTPHPVPGHALLELQRSVGNAAVVHLVRAHGAPRPLPGGGPNVLAPMRQRVTTLPPRESATADAGVDAPAPASVDAAAPSTAGEAGTATPRTPEVAPSPPGAPSAATTGDAGTTAPGAVAPVTSSDAGPVTTPPSGPVAGADAALTATPATLVPTPAGTTDAGPQPGAAGPVRTPAAGGAATGPAAGGEPAGDESCGPVPDEALIAQELAEHQSWGTASATVGGAGTSDRARFLAASIAAGMTTGADQGIKDGAGMAAGTRGLHYLASSAGVVARFPGAVRGVPLVGSIIGGVLAGFALKDQYDRWDNVRGSISRWGTGSSDYERYANDLDAVRTVLDVVTNVLDVLAGLLAVGAVALLFTGIGAPLAATLGSLALKIGLISTVISAVKVLMQQASVIFRALHNFTSDADPRAVEAEGAVMQTAAAGPMAFLGGMAATAATNRRIPAPPRPRPPTPPPPAPIGAVPPPVVEAQLPLPLTGPDATGQYNLPGIEPGAPRPATATGATSPSVADPAQLSLPLGPPASPTTAAGPSAEIPGYANLPETLQGITQPAITPPASGGAATPPVVAQPPQPATAGPGTELPGYANLPETLPGMTPPASAAPPVVEQLPPPAPGGPGTEFPGHSSLPTTVPGAPPVTDASGQMWLPEVDDAQTPVRPTPPMTNSGQMWLPGLEPPPPTPRPYIAGEDQLMLPGTFGDSDVDWSKITPGQIRRMDPMTGAFPYEPGATSGPYHGVVGSTVTDPATGALVHEPEAYFSTTGAAGGWGVRTGPGGAWFDHMFATRAEAEAYAAQRATAGEVAIRNDSALPVYWPPGADRRLWRGNPISSMNVFPVPPHTPMMTSAVAPQPEGVPVPSRPEVYPGGGSQTQLPGGMYNARSVPVASYPVGPNPTPATPEIAGFPLGPRTKAAADLAGAGVNAATLAGRFGPAAGPGEPVTVPVSPRYEPPRATLDDLAAQCAAIASLRQARAAAGAHADTLQSHVDALSAQQPSLQEAQEAARAAAERTRAHRAEVAGRSDKQRQQVERQRQVRTLLAGFQEHWVSMAAFKAMMWAATAVPGRIGTDARRFLHAINSVEPSTGRATAAQPGQQEQAAAAQATLQNVGAQAPALESSAASSVTGADAVCANTAQGVATTSAAAATTLTYAEQLDAEIARRVQERDATAARLAAWARAHQAARQDAVQGVCRSVEAAGATVTGAPPDAH